MFAITYVNVQIESAVAEQLKVTAKENGYSLASYISAVVSAHCASMLKKDLDTKKILLDLITTSDPDPTFERPAEIPWEVTTPREAFS